MIPRQRVSDHRGRLLVEVDLAELWDGVGPCLALHRADLHAVLLDGARDVPIRMGADVRGLREQDGTVSVEFGDGTAGEYDLVIGADGIRSTVRRLAFGDDATARPVGQVGWRFVTACPPEITTWSVMLGHRTAFLTIPIGNGRVYCYCDVVSSSGEDRDDDLGRLFSGFAEPVPEPLDSVAGRDLVHRSTIEEVALDSWVRGRVVLIGDAAHATSPNMAEGAAMALEDALVLAECLRATRACPRRPVGVRGPAPPANGLGPRTDASPRPNSLPPGRGPKRGPARLRPKDLPIELPTSARRGLRPNLLQPSPQDLSPDRRRACSRRRKVPGRLVQALSARSPTALEYRVPPI